MSLAAGILERKRSWDLYEAHNCLSLPSKPQKLPVARVADSIHAFRSFYKTSPKVARSRKLFNLMELTARYRVFEVASGRGPDPA